MVGLKLDMLLVMTRIESTLLSSGSGAVPPHLHFPPSAADPQVHVLLPLHVRQRAHGEHPRQPQQLIYVSKRQRLHTPRSPRG